MGPLLQLQRAPESQRAGSTGLTEAALAQPLCASKALPPGLVLCFLWQLQDAEGRGAQTSPDKKQLMILAQQKLKQTTRHTYYANWGQSGIVNGDLQTAAWRTLWPGSSELLLLSDQG